MAVRGLLDCLTGVAHILGLEYSPVFGNPITALRALFAHGHLGDMSGSDPMLGILILFAAVIVDVLLLPLRIIVAAPITIVAAVAAPLLLLCGCYAAPGAAADALNGEHPSVPLDDLPSRSAEHDIVFPNRPRGDQQLPRAAVPPPVTREERKAARAAAELDFEHAVVVLNSSGGSAALLIYLKKCGVTAKERNQMCSEISRAMAQGRGGRLTQDLAIRDEILRAVAKFRGGEGGGGAGRVQSSAPEPLTSEEALPIAHAPGNYLADERGIGLSGNGEAACNVAAVIAAAAAESEASASEGSLYPSASLPGLRAGAVPVVMGEPVGAIVGTSKPSLADQL